MAIIAMVLFSVTLGAAFYAIAATVAPRWSYMVALLAGEITAAAAQPVSARRRVRRIAPLSLRSQARLLHAAA